MLLFLLLLKSETAIYLKETVVLKLFLGVRLQTQNRTGAWEFVCTVVAIKMSAAFSKSYHTVVSEIPHFSPTHRIRSIYVVYVGKGLLFNTNPCMCCLKTFFSANPQTTFWLGELFVGVLTWKGEKAPFILWNTFYWRPATFECMI